MAEKQGPEAPDIQRRSAKRKASLVLDVLKGKTTITEACGLYDLTPSEVESWVDEGQRGLENALRARPQDVRDEYESKVKDLQAKVGELVLERDALKKLSALLDSTEKR